MHTENDRDYALSQQTDYVWRRVEKGKIEKYKAGHQRYGAKRLEKAAEVQKMAGRFHALMRKEESVETQLLAPQPNGRLRSRLQPAAQRKGMVIIMKRMKKIVCFVLALTLVASLAACGKAPAEDGKGDAPVMGVCIFAMESEYFTNLAHWLEEAGAAHGWDVIVQSGDASNPASQVEIIENFITMDVDAIFINPINIAAVEDALAKAKENDIWVFGHNYRYEDSEIPDIYMAGDPTETGAQITDLAKSEVDKVLGDTPVVAAAMTNLDNENNSRRSDGMVARAKELWGEDALVAENSPGNTAEAMSAAENIIQANPDVNVWLCYNDECAIGVYEFYNASGRDQSKAVIVGADGNKDVLQAIIQGSAVRGTLSQTLNVKCDKIFSAADILMESGDVEAAQDTAGYDLFTPINSDNAQEELDATSWR